MPENTDATARRAAAAEELLKLTKAELAERVLSLGERLDEAERAADEHRYRGPSVSQSSVQASMAITALVDLHRASVHDGAADARYLKAARVLGDELVSDIGERPEG